MKINGGNNGPVRPDRPIDSRSREGIAAGEGRQSKEPIPRRGDRVEISQAGSARAGEVLHALAADTPDRMQQVKQRILSGAYDASGVVAQVARRILDRGDL